MKVQKKAAVALLVALGFSKASEWDNEKLKQKVAQIPAKVAEDDVPEGHEELYAELVKAKGNVEITDGEVADADEAPPKTKDKKKDNPAAEDDEDEAPAPAPKSKDKDEKKKKEKPTAAPEKPKSKDKGEKKKPAATPAKKVERDDYGCAVGTISAKVNAEMTDEWQSEEELAEAAGVTLNEARGRLYYGAEQKVFERRRLIQYRKVPAKKTSK